MTSSSRATIDHSTLAQLVEVGAVRGASVIGQPAGWGVRVKYGRTERSLAARRGQVRLFRKLETVVTYLRNIGIAKFEVDAGGFDPDKLRRSRSRPDSARVMKRAHEAISHDQWFREQVRLGMADLASGKTLSEAEHDVRWAKRRAALVKRAAKA
jgi:hypothetical protein